MRIYTYSAPGAKDEAQLTEEFFRDYKDCGFDVIMLTGLNNYNGEGWANSKIKKCFDIAKKVGIKEVIFDDLRIYKLSTFGDNLVGIGDQYKYQSTDELDAYIKDCMREYIDEELFLGLRLSDEPLYDSLKSYGQVYRSVKRVAKQLGKENIYLQINMNPMFADFYIKLCPEKDKNISDAYEYYLDCVLKETGADRISVDNYPFRPDQLGGYFLDGYYKCFQILRKKCDEYNVEMSFVLQSFEMYHKTKPWGKAGFRRITSLNQMLLQTNSALGFGARDLSFYTYITHCLPPENAWRSEEGCSFVTNAGEKTAIYYWGKVAIEYIQKLSKTLFEYDYIGSNLRFSKDKEELAFTYLGCGDYVKADGTKPTDQFDNSFASKIVKNVEFNKDVLLSTEFIGKDGTSLCMFENVIDHIFQDDIRPMKIKVDFGNEYSKAKYFDGNEFVEIAIEDGCFYYELSMGEALWIIPVKD